MLMSHPIQLRELREEDKNEYFKWINDKDLVNFNNAYKPISWQEHCNWFSNTLNVSDMIIFSIVHCKTETLIGSCSLRNINNHSKNAELQIRIGEKNFRNKGFGTIAVKLLLEFGFLDLNIKRIYLNVFNNNIAAIKSYSKVGFVKEGLLRKAEFINGEFIDVIVMSILDNEYLQ